MNRRTFLGISLAVIVPNMNRHEGLLTCMKGHGEKECRYLGEDSQKYGCLKLDPVLRKIIDEEISAYNEYVVTGGGIMEEAPLGDYCEGLSPNIRF